MKRTEQRMRSLSRGSGLLVFLSLLLWLALLTLTTSASSVPSVEPRMLTQRRGQVVDESRLTQRIQTASSRNSKLVSSRTTRSSEVQQRMEQAQTQLDRQLRRNMEASRPSVQKASSEKLDWMQKRTDEASNGVISMTSEEFKEYVFQGPRPYHVFLTMTGTAPQHRCYSCRHYQEATAIVARSHRQQQQQQQHRQTGQGVEGDGEFSTPLFFVELDMGPRTHEIFEAANLRQIPSVMMIKKRSTPNPPSRKLSTFLRKHPAKYRFQQMQRMIEPSDLTAFIFKTTNRQIDVEVPINRLQLVFIVGLLLALPYAVFRFWDYLILVRRQTMLIVSCVLIWYSFCIAGGMYNIIRGTPFAWHDKDGATYINRAMRDQYGAETWIVSILVLAAALSLLILGALASPLSAYLPKNSIFSTSAAGASSSSSSSRRQKSGLDYLRIPVVYVLLLMFVWFEYLSIYTTKSPYYRMGLLF